jgi:hypothetical protein
MQEVKNAYGILVGKSERKRPHGVLRMHGKKYENKLNM